jgi:hypothetical protein
MEGKIEITGKHLFPHLEGCGKLHGPTVRPNLANGRGKKGEGPWAVIHDLISSRDIANAQPSSARQKL